VFSHYPDLSFLLALLYIIAYNAKYHMFVKSIKQSNNTLCMDRHVQQVMSVTLFTQ